MTKTEWLRLKPFVREIRANPKGGWASLQGRRAVKGRGKGYGQVYRNSRVIPGKVKFVRDYKHQIGNRKEVTQ